MDVALLLRYEWTVSYVFKWGAQNRSDVHLVKEKTLNTSVTKGQSFVDPALSMTRKTIMMYDSIVKLTFATPYFCDEFYGGRFYVLRQPSQLSHLDTMFTHDFLVCDMCINL